MPSISKPVRKKDGTYTCRVRFFDSSQLPNYKTKTYTAESAAAAKSLAYKDVQDYDKGLLNPWTNTKKNAKTSSNKYKLQNLIIQYKVEKQHRWTQSTRNLMEVQFAALLKEHGNNTLVGDLESWHFEKIINSHSSYFTAERYCNTYSAFCKWLHKNGYIGKPLKLELQVRKHSPIITYVTVEELKAIKKAIVQRAREQRAGQILHANPEANQLYLIRLLNFAFITGLRRSELIDLRVKDIDQELGYLHIRNSKGKREDSMPYYQVKPLVKIIERQIWKLKKENLYQPNQRLFLISSGDRLSKSFKKYVRLALPPHRAEKIKFHSLRHGSATWLLQHLSISEVSEWLRHNDIRTTLKYAKIVKKELANKVGNAFNKL